MDLLRMESFPSSVNQRISSAISMELLRMESCGGRNVFQPQDVGYIGQHKYANSQRRTKRPTSTAHLANHLLQHVSPRKISSTAWRKRRPGITHKTKTYCHQRLAQIVSTLSGSRPGHPDCPACKFSQPCPAQLRQQTQRNSARKLGQPSQAR